MNTNDLLANFKYYHLENEKPKDMDDTASLWWDGEKNLLEQSKNDSSFLTRLENNYSKYLDEGALHGILKDTSQPLTKRLIIFYLDLWHGKWFPYDNLDIIHTY